MIRAEFVRKDSDGIFRWYPARTEHKGFAWQELRASALKLLDELGFADLSHADFVIELLRRLEGGKNNAEKEEKRERN